MPPAKSHVPEGMSPVIPQLVVSDAHALAAFASKAFDAKLEHFMPGPEGNGIAHGVLRIGGAPIFLSDVPGFAKPTIANLMVYVPDVDASVAKAVAEGATVIAPAADMFWGDRWSMLSDPWGTIWQVATHKELVLPDEMMRRMEANAPPKS